MRKVGESDGFTITTHDSGDIFVTSITGVSLRIAHKGRGVIITSSGNEFSPDSVNGLPAIRVITRD